MATTKVRNVTVDTLLFIKQTPLRHPIKSFIVFGNNVIVFVIKILFFSINFVYTTSQNIYLYSVAPIYNIIHHSRVPVIVIHIPSI